MSSKIFKFGRNGSKKRKDSSETEGEQGYLEPISSVGVGSEYLTMAQSGARGQSDKDESSQYMALTAERSTTAISNPYVIVESEPVERSYTEIPNKLQGQKRQDLSGQKLAEIPKEVLEDMNLEELILDQNHLQMLPHEVLEMPSLSYLSVSSQQETQPSRSPYPALRKIELGAGSNIKLTHLFLYNNAIMKLPSDFYKLTNLRHLDLRLNQLIEFPYCLCRMIDLIVLHLSSNRIRSIPEDISKLAKLEVLTLANNEIEAIPEGLCQLKKLDYLDIQNNQIKELPRSMAKLKGLLPDDEETVDTRRLHVEGNPLVYPPEDHRTSTQKLFAYIQMKQKSSQSMLKRRTAFEIIEMDPCLKRYLKDNQLHSREPTPCDGNSFFYALEDQLKRPDINLIEFTKEELRQKLVDFIANLPEEASKIDALNGEKETAIPPLIAWLQSRERSQLESYCQRMSQDGQPADDVTVQVAATMLSRDISVIAKSTVSVFTSKAMDGSQSSVWCTTYKGGEGKPLCFVFCDSFFQSIGLSEDERTYDDTRASDDKSTQVNLAGKGLKKLPDWVSEKVDVETLLLGNNHLTDMDWWKDLQNLLKLKRLDLSHQRPKEETREYKSLTNIPKNIHFYTQHLTELAMSKNRIERLPVEISFMHSLQLLDFIDNHISEIPEELCELKNLQYLGLSNNRLKHVPQKIAQLKNLLVLRLSHNHLVELPESISDLSQLQVLSLSHNRLVKLPMQLFKLQQLLSRKVYRNPLLPRSEFRAALHVEGNTILEFPNQDISNSGTEKIFKYLKHMDERPRDRATIIARLPITPPTISERHDKFKWLTDKLLNSLSTHLGRDWRSLGTYLDMEVSKLDQIEDNNHRDVQRAILSMLLTWKNQNFDKGEEKLTENLKFALTAVGRTDLQCYIESVHRGGSIV